MKDIYFLTDTAQTKSSYKIKLRSSLRTRISYQRQFKTVSRSDYRSNKVDNKYLPIAMNFRHSIRK